MSLPIRVLDRVDVRRALQGVDPVAVCESVLRRHADGSATQPAEGYLPWTNAQGGACRSLAMPGALARGLSGDDDPVFGLKVINAATTNPARGLDRAGGLGLVFDPETARPVLLAEVALISALRTAAYTTLSVRLLGPPAPETLALVGAGAQARTHLDLLVPELPTVRTVLVHDADPARAEALAARGRAEHPELEFGTTPTAAGATRRAQVVVTVTTSTRPYLGPADLSPGTLVAHVSLDDVDAEVIAAAEGLFVDDEALVRENPRRILGALLRDGLDRGLDGTLGDVLTGRRPAIRPQDGVVVSNPFGMAALDVGLLAVVEQEARRLDLGRLIDLVPDDILTEQS